jgi:hypothetical protein
MMHATCMYHVLVFTPCDARLIISRVLVIKYMLGSITFIKYILFVVFGVISENSKAELYKPTIYLSKVWSKLILSRFLCIYENIYIRKKMGKWWLSDNPGLS